MYTRGSAVPQHVGRLCVKSVSGPPCPLSPPELTCSQGWGKSFPALFSSGCFLLCWGVSLAPHDFAPPPAGVPQKNWGFNSFRVSHIQEISITGQMSHPFGMILGCGPQFVSGRDGAPIAQNFNPLIKTDSIGFSPFPLSSSTSLRVLPWDCCQMTWYPPTLP